MRWEGGRRSENVEDRRGVRVSRAGGLGIGTLVLALVAMYFGIDPRIVMQGAEVLNQGGTTTEQVDYQASPEEQRAAELSSVVLADTEDVWREQFQAMGRSYREPVLVMYSGAVESGCGIGQSQMGPFYCPADQKLYLDLSFFDDLHQRFGAPGDFAQAYVIAHEVGHHVQTLLGLSQKVQEAQRRMGQGADANQLSVRFELQADCLAGVWGHHADRARHILEQGDVEEGLAAASAIGDDRLQKQAGGRVVPESFTHGSSAQRVRWFKRGLETGDLQQCDTFDAQAP